jgi:hypothetical protein
MRRGLYVLLGVLLVPTVGLVGDIVTDGKLKSTLASGAPLEVDSPDMVANLNADMVDGIEGTDIYTMAEVDALVAAATARKKYYLSALMAYGNTALTRCGTGYHMASVYEIYDPSNLQYAWDDPNAYLTDDSGKGPPAGEDGWVRTGESEQEGPGPDGAGVANCLAWTSNDGGHFGTAVSISPEWTDPTAGGYFLNVPGTLWMGLTFACNEQLPVWCIED